MVDSEWDRPPTMWLCSVCDDSPVAYAVAAPHCSACGGLMRAICEPTTTVAALDRTARVRRPWQADD